MFSSQNFSRPGYGVIVYDLMLFGSAGLPSHPNLQVVTGDIRDTAKYADAVTGCDYVIHMACISNDPSFDLDPSLSRTINYECFEPFVLASKSAGVNRFVYVSSSSVYGVSKSPEVTEEHPLVPLTDYNKYKGLCEPILFRHQSPEFICVTIRPATVCGYSPRMRFDLTVNILTNHAYNKGVITIFGGKPAAAEYSHRRCLRALRQIAVDAAPKKSPVKFLTPAIRTRR